MRDRPIGVFDSGLGGLTVVQALADLLPSEDVVYLGDTARYPYGERSEDEVARFAEAIAHELVARDCKLVVIACNSATAAALDRLRSRIDVPVVGVVEPGLRAAAKATRTGRALVIATKLTAHSGVYERVASQIGIEVSTLACPGFVELVEEGRAEDPATVAIVRERLAPRLTSRIDTLVLGCTHFPLLARPLSEVVGRRTTLVSSADEVAFEVHDLLDRLGWRRTSSARGRLTLLTTGERARFALLAGRFLGARRAEVRTCRITALEGGGEAAGAAAG
jgi:glutamate racemase